MFPSPVETKTKRRKERKKKKSSKERNNLFTSLLEKNKKTKKKLNKTQKEKPKIIYKYIYKEHLIYMTRRETNMTHGDLRRELRVTLKMTPTTVQQHHDQYLHGVHRPRRRIITEVLKN